MNGIGVRGGSPPEVTEKQIARLVEFAKGDDRLRMCWEVTRRACVTDVAEVASVGLWPRTSAIRPT